MRAFRAPNCNEPASACVEYFRASRIEGEIENEIENEIKNEIEG